MTQEQHDSRFGQALAYAWGRFDTDNREYDHVSHYPFTSDEFATYYVQQWRSGNPTTLYAAFQALAAYGRSRTPA